MPHKVRLFKVSHNHPQKKLTRNHVSQRHALTLPYGQVASGVSYQPRLAENLNQFIKTV